MKVPSSFTTYVAYTWITPDPFISTVRKRRKIYVRALKHWQKLQERGRVNTLDGLCSYFADFYDSEIDIMDLPEVTAPKGRWYSNSYWYSCDESGRRKRVKCLERAIARCDKAIEKEQKLKAKKRKS